MPGLQAKLRRHLKKGAHGASVGGAPTLAGRVEALEEAVDALLIAQVCAAFSAICLLLQIIAASACHRHIGNSMMLERMTASMHACSGQLRAGVPLRNEARSLSLVLQQEAQLEHGGEAKKGACCGCCALM